MYFSLVIILVRSEEDRRRLVQLLQLAEPIEQTVKLYHDRRPEKTEKYSSNNYDPQSLSMNKSVTVNGKNTLKSTGGITGKLDKSSSKTKLGNSLGGYSSTKLSHQRPQTGQPVCKFPLEYRYINFL